MFKLAMIAVALMTSACATEGGEEASTTTLCSPGNYDDYNTGDSVSTKCRPVCHDPCLDTSPLHGCTSTGGPWTNTTTGITYNKCFTVTP